MIDISICMVSLNSWDVLKDCLDSLSANLPPPSYEVIVADNASSDGTPDKLEAHFPNARLIRNDRNVGFTKATNQALTLSSGQYLLWLNTDTLLRPDSLGQLWRFVEANPHIGIAGPKVLNRDGTFQPQCRRGLPTPLASLCHMLRLDQLWPHDRTVGQYLLTYLPVDSPNQVDAVSGCCLLARRQVWDDIGSLDEDIFGFGEDIDWCVRAKNVGWEVWYYPGSEIVHLKGQGGVHARPYHKVWGIHQAMWVFYRKHLRSRYPWPVTVAVWLGVTASLPASLVGTWLRRRLPVQR